MSILTTPLPHRSALAVLLGLLSAPVALAHDFWIEPKTFRPDPGEQVTISLRVGEDFSGDSQPLVPGWFTDYSVTSPARKQPVRGRIGDDPAGYFIADPDGSQLIGYRSSRSFVDIDPPTFNDYLAKEGLDWVRERREERGEAERNAREYFSRCAKSLVRSSSASSGAGFDTVLDYTLELIPLRDPYGLSPGAAMPVELRYLGEPIEGLLVIAFTADDPQNKQQMRTDQNGRAVLQLERPGTWLVKAVHIIELDDSERDAEWESFWASLTFELGSRPEVSAGVGAH